MKHSILPIVYDEYQILWTASDAWRFADIHSNRSANMNAFLLLFIFDMYVRTGYEKEKGRKCGRVGGTRAAIVTVRNISRPTRAEDLIFIFILWNILWYGPTSSSWPCLPRELPLPAAREYVNFYYGFRLFVDSQLDRTFVGVSKRFPRFWFVFRTTFHITLTFACIFIFF